MYVKYFTAAYVYHLELECGTTHYSNKPRGMPRPKARKKRVKPESHVSRAKQSVSRVRVYERREKEREKVEFHHLKGREKEKERKRKRRTNITCDDS